MMFIPSMQPRDDRPDGDRGFVSLRDYLAAAALNGLLSDRKQSEEDPIYGKDHVDGDGYSRVAYLIADAMLRHREKKQ